MEQIAVVGATIRVPGADSVERLWAKLMAGKSSIEPLSVEDLAGVAACERQAPGYVARAGWIDGIEDFDYRFFDYSFREAQHVDPQQRLLLTLSHRLIEAVAPQTRNVGVFVSVGFPSYLIGNLLPAGADPALSSMGNSSHGAATRIAYKLNLTGPALSVESGCSSSLVALHMARLAILTGQCEMALVGGCSLRIPAKQGYLHQRDGVLSEDGVCRPFDERATGTVFASGAVVVAVKKLSAALAHGDDVWCVVRGTAVNNDGSTKAGFTAPSVHGQRELVRRVYARTGVSPRGVGYLEAHGTGTALGDPIEFQALSEAFSEFTTDRGFCSLGSIKANVGHLDVAAGLTGLLKASLCLRWRELPPLANFSAISPKIDLAASPFCIDTESRRWDTSEATPRRAAVNSLGVGGTNAHALLEEAPARRPGLGRRWGLMFASANTPADLKARAKSLIAAAEAEPDQVGDLAYTSQLAAPGHAMHGACFVDVAADVHSERLYPNADWRGRDLIFAFSGQGAQYPGMGSELYGHLQGFRAAFDRAAGLFRAVPAADPVALLGARAEEISDTRVLQPYLFALEYALGSVLLDLGLRPAALLGHSLGEYLAATFAGVFDLETAVRLVAERARLMGSAPPGAMLSVQAAPQDLQRYLGDQVSLCVVNGRRSSVVGGAPAAIDELAGHLERAGEKATRLNTSHAFHSHLMEEAAARFEGAFDGIALKLPQIPIISNLDGCLDDPERFADPGYWLRQLRQPVDFYACLQTIAATCPPSVVLELGPGRTLATHLLSSFPERENAVLSSLTPGREREQLFALLGQLRLNGVTLDLGALDGGQRGRIIPLPPSPLHERRCWVDAVEGAAAASSVAGGLRKQERISDWLYQQRWSPRLRSDTRAAAESGKELTLFSTRRGAGAALQAALEGVGARVRRIDFEDLPWSSGDPAELEQGITERLGDRRVERAVALFASPAGATSMGNMGEAADAVLVAGALVKSLRQALGGQTELLVIGVQGVRTADEPLYWWNGWLDGFATVAQQELTGIPVRYLDIDEGLCASPSALLARTIINGDERVSALRGGLLWERALRALPAAGNRGAPPSSLRRVLILGGTGNVGLVYASHFLRTGALGIAIVSRHAESVAPRLAAGDTPDRRIWARRRRLMDEAEGGGVDLYFANADATSPEEVERVVEQAQRRFGELDAIVLASGAPAEQHFRALVETDRAHLERLYHAKLAVAQSADRVARRAGVPRVIVVSSISSVLGGLGLLGYATSHNLLEAYAAASSDECCRWSAVSWDAWNFYQQERPADAIETAIDALAISEKEGLQALSAIADAGWPAQVIVSSGDLHHRHATWVQRSGAEPSRVERGERPPLREEYVAPRGPTDRRLAELVGAAVGLKTVGVRDNFFELGGDSMIALGLVENINRELQGDISVIDIFKYPTVEKLTDRLAGTLATASLATDPHQPDTAAQEARAVGRRGYFEAMRKRSELQP